ncbi:MAG: hypothetical protein AAFR61_09995 [Bacteroidota bacterium]
MKKQVLITLLGLNFLFGGMGYGQPSVSVGITTGWGIGSLSTGNIDSGNLLRVGNFLVIPAGIQSRISLNESWSVQVRAMLYSSQFSVQRRVGNVWRFLPGNLDQTHGGLELSAVRRLLRLSPSFFLSAEAGLSLQVKPNQQTGCLPTATASQVNETDTLFLASRLSFQGKPAFVAGHLRVGLEYDFQWGRRPVTVTAGGYLKHALHAFWEGELALWNTLPLEAEPVWGRWDPTGDPIGYLAEWNCGTEASLAPETTHQWRDYGFSFGLQASFLFRLSS